MIMEFMLKALFFALVIYQVQSAAKPCALRAISGADGVCVCNQTYCDDFPALQKPAKDSALVYESGKSGNRFKETTIKIEASLPNATQSRETQTVTINKAKTYQKILGFGGSFTDVTGAVLNELPKSLTDALLSSLFSDNGLQYSMGRVPMAATDYSYRHYTFDDVKDDFELDHFALAEEDHKFKLPYIKRALAHSPGLRLVANPWYAPQWMKTNATRETKSVLLGEVGGKYYETWAKYFVKFLDAYQKEGVDVWALTTQNEPTLVYWCYFPAEYQRVWIEKNLGPNLKKAGHENVTVLAYDDNVGDLQAYAKTILSDQTAAQYVNGLAYHWYGNSRTSDNPPADILDDLHQKYPDKFLLMTEASHLDGMGNGRWDYAEHYGHDMLRAINHWTRGWIEWNMVLPLKGCPKNESGRCGDKLFSSVIQVDLTTNEAFKQPSFYVIGHLSKFLVRDSVRIEHTVDKEVDGLQVLTGQRPDGGIVVVALNRNDTAVDLRLIDGSKHLAHTIPERSIQTFLWY